MIGLKIINMKKNIIQMSFKKFIENKINLKKIKNLYQLLDLILKSARSPILE